MKRIFFIATILLFTAVSYAQKDTTFYKHEVKASIGDAVWAEFFWTYSAWGSENELRNNAALYANISFSYLYRPVKWFWVGGNLIGYVGEMIDYTWREYAPDGRFRDFSKSKMKFCAVIAPEIRFSYLNRKNAILYGALSGGVGIENGYDRVHHTYPEINSYFQVTYFGFSINFGEKKNIFLGGEAGIGFKGIFIFHSGYRF